MEESALTSALTGLDTSWSSLEHWLWACAFVVFAGVAIEIIPISWEYRVELHEFWRGIIHSPERPSRTRFGLELVGSALIALGVFGELVVGIMMAKIETDMRDDTAKLVSLIGQRAKDAEGRAAKADLARVQLEKSMMIRRLSPRQARAVCSAVPNRFMDQVNVTSSSQDWEAFRYAQDFAGGITKCIYAAGFGSRGFSGSLGVGNSFWSTNVVFGVWVRFPKHFTLDNPKSNDIMFNPAKRRALAERVRNALVSSGVKVEGISNDGRSLIDLYVGPRKFPGPTGNASSAASAIF